MPTLADQIRAHIGPAHDAADRALLAVIDKCEVWRTVQIGPNNEPIGQHITNEFLTVIARELGITTEETA